jgi:thiol-disulfide isomerase/thioredoxin
MRLRKLFSAFLLSLAISAANAQTTEPAKAAPPADQTKPAAATDATKPADAAKPGTPAPREIPPDSKAFQDAMKITVPADKIAALEKFKKDFPNSTSLGSANANILSTMASKMPEQKAQIQAFAKNMVKGAKDKKEQGSMSGQIADTLLTNNLLLKDAEKYAKTSLASMNQATFVADEKAAAEKRAATATAAGRTAPKPPSDEDIIKRFKSSRAVRLAALGRIEFALGKNSAAQKLLDESYATNPSQPVVAGALGEIAAKKGDSAKAMDYLVTAKLSGRAPASASLALTNVYSKTHGGSAVGLDALLDAEYNKRFPNPVHLDAYKPTEKRSDRLVLAELFTGSGCPPCVGADLAFEAASERYSRKDVMVVVYHEHVPQPDPMTNLDTAARAKYYSGAAGLPTPTYYIDGEIVKYNGASREGAKDVVSHVEPPIEKALETAAEAHLTVNATSNGNAVNVSAAVDGVKSDSKDLKVHVLLIEKELRYTGENGIRFHPMVVRAMGGKDDDGFALTSNAASFDQAWDLEKVSAGLKAHLDDYEVKGHRGVPFKFSEKKYQIDRANLAVVVFVQDAKTKHILQSAYVDLNPSTPHVSTEANDSK